MRKRSLEEMYHLTSAQWPYWFCVVAPDPLNGLETAIPSNHNGVSYPPTGCRLYTNIEAIDIMRKLSERGITSRAIGPCDNFTLADEIEADHLLDEIETKDESRRPSTPLSREAVA